MTTELTTNTDLQALLDSYDGELPESNGTGLGTFIWLHGTNKSGAKTPGVFYMKDTEIADLPEAPWALDTRYEDQEEPERGFSAPLLRIAPIIWHSQWFMEEKDDAGQRVTRRGPKQWIDGYRDGAQKHLDLICLVEGVADPMLLSANGQNKCGAMLEILSRYRNGLLRQATFRAKRAGRSMVPPWTYWLPIANKKTADGKTHYEPVKDGRGQLTGSVVTPPTLFLPADAIDCLLVTPDQFRAGAEVYQAYLEWSREKRQAPDESGYTISEAPAQIATGRNVPQPIDIHHAEGELVL